MAGKPRILHLTHHFAPCIGGVERIVQDLCSGLVKDGFVSDVACLNKCANSNKALKAKEKTEGIQVHRVPFLDLKYYKFAPSVRKLFGDYDILHIHGLGFFSDLALLLRPLHKKKVVLSTHGGVSHTKKVSLLKWPYFNIWARLLLRGADAVCACSKADEALFKRVSNRVVLMENGVNVERYLKLGIRKEPKSFMYAGRLSANKRVDLLLRVFAAAKEGLKGGLGGFRLYIVGEDWEGLLPGLRKLAKELGIAENVEFAGKVSDDKLLEYFAKSRFFISASRYEGFGITAVEAMASGCVPLLNGIPTFRQFVKGGKTGRIVDWENAGRAAEQVAGIATMGAAGIDAVARAARDESRRYGWGERVKEFAKLYENIVQKSK